MKKILFVATVFSHIEAFHIPIINKLSDDGNDVEVAANMDIHSSKIGNKIHDIPFSRSPLSASNITAYKRMKKLSKRTQYDIVHCHTPVAAMIARTVFRNKKTKVIYTAHGFHFYKGAPLKNWLLYYPVEKYLSKFTDTLITINDEDFKRSVRKFNAKKNIKLNGVGIDVSKIEKTHEKNFDFISDDKFTLLSIGELNDNKNHISVINEIKKMENVEYIIAGRGKLFNDLTNYINNEGLENKIKLIGYREDIFSIIKASDIFVFPSKREGLPASIIEAMAGSLPVVASNIRGNNDIVSSDTGFLYDINSQDEMIQSITKLFDDKLRLSMGQSANKVSHKYDLNLVLEEQIKIYD